MPAVPLIGISAYRETARWGVWDTAAVLVPAGYVDAVTRSGGRPVVLPPTDLADDPVLDVLDGLLLAGGADIDPARYGDRAHPATTGLRTDRDAAELALLRRADEVDLPVLGVCRGMQLMVVAAGGRLVQHLPDVVGHEGHRPAPGRYGEHSVDLAAGSLAATLLGPRARVRSYHHQGVADAGVLTVSGHAEDGTVEAVEDPARRFALGVLWHPEAAEDDDRVVAGLVDAAGRRRPPRPA